MPAPSRTGLRAPSRGDDDSRLEHDVLALGADDRADVVAVLPRGEHGDAASHGTGELLLEPALEDLLRDGLRDGQHVLLLAGQGREGDGPDMATGTPGHPVPDEHAPCPQLLGDPAGAEGAEGGRMDADGAGVGWRGPRAVRGRRRRALPAGGGGAV